jgi:hypothetical protein
MDLDAKAFRVPEFCKRYVISKAGLYREVAAKRLQITKRGHTTLITYTEAERWFAELPNSQPK